MKERETKIGPFRIVQTDSGFKFNPLSKFHTEWYSLTSSDADELKNWLAGYKEISYQDRTYLDKRKLLRQLSTKDEIRNYVNIITDKIWEKLLLFLEHTQRFSFLDELILYNYIKSLLIDGYLAFEIIFDETQKNIIDLQPIDPCSLTPVFLSAAGERKNDFDWVQFPDNEILKRVLLKSQVIYISYSSGNEYSPISYVDEMKDSYEIVRRLDNELISSKLNLPGEVSKKMGGKITFKQLKRADKKLQFMSKIPKSILKEEKTFSDDVRYNKFISRISQIFETELLKKLIETKNNL